MSYMSEKITALTDGDFSLKSSVSHSIETTRLIDTRRPRGGRRGAASAL